LGRQTAVTLRQNPHAIGQRLLASPHPKHDNTVQASAAEASALRKARRDRTLSSQSRLHGSRRSLSMPPSAAAEYLHRPCPQIMPKRTPSVYSIHSGERRHHRVLPENSRAVNQDSLGGGADGGTQRQGPRGEVGAPFDHGNLVALVALGDQRRRGNGDESGAGAGRRSVAWRWTARPDCSRRGRAPPLPPR
jgi:hypothetical protein